MPRFTARPTPPNYPQEFQPYYVRLPQRWAVDQERQRHYQACLLYTSDAADD